MKKFMQRCILCEESMGRDFIKWLWKSYEAWFYQTVTSNELNDERSIKYLSCF